MSGLLAGQLTASFQPKCRQDSLAQWIPPVAVSVISCVIAIANTYIKMTNNKSVNTSSDH
eukprot:1001412-Amphidinium_carterae.1